MRNLNVSLSYMPWWTSFIWNRVIIRSSVTLVHTRKLPKLVSPTSSTFILEYFLIFFVCSASLSHTHTHTHTLMLYNDTCQHSAVTINPYTWHQHDTKFYFFSITSKAKIYSVLMLSDQLSSPVNTLQDFFFTFPSCLLCHIHASFLFFVYTCHLVMTCHP